MVSWISIIFFLSYYYILKKFTDYFFYETYNTRLQERYRDGHLTHPGIDPNLWFDHSVELIKIRFTVSQTLRLRICERDVVYQLLVPRHWVQAPNLRPYKQLCENKLKLRQPNLVLRWPNFRSEMSELRRIIQGVVVKSWWYMLSTSSSTRSD